MISSPPSDPLLPSFQPLIPMVIPGLIPTNNVNTLKFNYNTSPPLWSSLSTLQITMVVWPYHDLQPLTPPLFRYPSILSSCVLPSLWTQFRFLGITINPFETLLTCLSPVSPSYLFGKISTLAKLRYWPDNHTSSWAAACGWKTSQPSSPVLASGASHPLQQMQDSCSSFFLFFLI